MKPAGREVSLLVVLFVIAAAGGMYLVGRPPQRVGFIAEDFGHSEVTLSGDSMRMSIDLSSVIQMLSHPILVDSIHLDLRGGGGIRVLCGATYNGGYLVSDLAKTSYVPAQNLHVVGPSVLSRAVVNLRRFQTIRLLPLSRREGARGGQEWSFDGTTPLRTLVKGKFREIGYVGGLVHGITSGENPVALYPYSVPSPASGIFSFTDLQLGSAREDPCHGAGRAVLQLFGGARLSEARIYAPDSSYLVLDGNGPESSRSNVFIHGIGNAVFPRLRGGELTVGALARSVGGLHRLVIRSASTGTLRVVEEKQRVEYEDSAGHVVLSGENLTRRRWEQVPAELLAVMIGALLAVIGYLLQRLLRPGL